MTCVAILKNTSSPSKPLSMSPPSKTQTEEAQTSHHAEATTQGNSQERLQLKNREFLIQKIEREINVELVRRAFKKNSEKIERFIKENLHDMVSRLLASGRSQKISLKDDHHICDVKVRFFHDEIQVLVKTWLGSGGFKKVEKVAQLAGPFLPNQPGPVYAYAKIEERKELRSELKNLEIALSDAIESNASLKQVSDLRQKRTFLRARIDSVQSDLLEEVAISKEFPHSHVVQMWTVTNQKDPTGVKGVMMELCEGGDLWDFVGTLSFPLTAADLQRNIGLAARMCQTLADIHTLGRGRCHLDMKSGNILLKEEKGQIIPKLTDFGLSKTTGSFLNHPCGTPAYMAPELYLPPKCAHPSMDAWSLGIICAELFYGLSSNKFLFDKEALSAAHDFFNHDRYPKNLSVWERIGGEIKASLTQYPGIDDIIRHLLDINPITRWTAQKAAEAFGLLQQFPENKISQTW